MVFDLNMEPEDGMQHDEPEDGIQHENLDNVSATHSHTHVHVSSAGDVSNDVPSGRDSMNDSVQASGEGANTGATIEEPTEVTAGSAEGGLNDGTADAISTPKPPSTEMRFDSFEAAKEHYRAYAESKGFTIRIDWSRRDSSDDLARVYLVCTKSGKPYAPKEDTQNPKPAVKKRKKGTHPRTGCQAHCYVKRRGAWWHVAKCTDEHNHPLIIKPSLTKFLRAHRNIPDEEKHFLRMLHACNIPTFRQMQLMARFYGKLEDVPYIAKDVANLRASFRRENSHHDMQDTILYFEKQKDLDKDFFYRMKLDEEDRVQYIYWVDGPARLQYKSYSDIVSFDTTYLTNRYKMPCAPFIGINNHGQSIQFGCGFIRNELSGSFEWLMQVFLEAMDGVAPKNIITDQCFSMRSAIDEVFKNAVHRNCRWHIMQNLTERMGPFMAKHPELCAAFNNCVNSSLSPEEFEANWELMIESFGVRDNTDLFEIWKHRQCWVPAYFMHDFFPFLQTTSRSEGFNAVLKRYINPKNSIYDFVKQYATLQDKILNDERKADAETALIDPDFWCHHPIELQMAKAYSRGIFNRFQKELEKHLSYHCRHIVGYQFELSVLGSPVPHYGSRSYNVIANWEEGIYSCNCCKFERDGILCCHVMKVMTQIGVREIPERYILKRWGWDAEEILGQPDGTRHPPKQGMPKEARDMMELASMRDDFRKVAKVGIRTADGKKVIKTHLKQMKQELEVINKREEKKAREAEIAALAMPSTSAPTTPRPPKSVGPSSIRRTSSNPTDVPTGSASGSHLSSTQHVQNPPMSNTRGRPQAIANKNPLDLAPKKAKHCSFCQSPHHTIRKCTERLRLLGTKPTG